MDWKEANESKRRMFRESFMRAPDAPIQMAQNVDDGRALFGFVRKTVRFNVRLAGSGRAAMRAPDSPCDADEILSRGGGES